MTLRAVWPCPLWLAWALMTADGEGSAARGRAAQAHELVAELAPSFGEFDRDPAAYEAARQALAALIAP